ncbi:hypothetical protein POTOM_001475 [Populus tomentosa]|uniref:Uncharacterized protein n=1 Tax=Populus tomentosa TaxID=118781 RepID=A0A8X8DI14_POPTO|nr:hypothetical protein POTOM_001475 [Populus tomentosa]
MSSLLTNQYVSSAVDVSFTGEADQCTDVSADRLRHDRVWIDLLLQCLAGIVVSWILLSEYMSEIRKAFIHG